MRPCGHSRQRGGEGCAGTAGAGDGEYDLGKEGYPLGGGQVNKKGCRCIPCQYGLGMDVLRNFLGMSATLSNQLHGHTMSVDQRVMDVKNIAESGWIDFQIRLDG